MDRPIYKEVIVEKPVYRDVVRPVYTSSKAKLNIPKYQFVGSKQTRKFHKRTCRLGKLIKKKYKISNNSQAHFRNMKFKACKVCILKKKKV